MTWWETKIQQVLKDPKYKKYYDSVNLLPGISREQGFAASVEKDNTTITEFLKAIGLYKEYKEKK